MRKRGSLAVNPEKCLSSAQDDHPPLPSVLSGVIKDWRSPGSSSEETHLKKNLNQVQVSSGCAPHRNRPYKGTNVQIAARRKRECDHPEEQGIHGSLEVTPRPASALKTR